MMRGSCALLLVLASLACCVLAAGQAMPCGAPPAPPNGSYWATSCDGAVDMAICNATCMVGYVAQQPGEPFAVCVGGSWQVYGSCVSLCLPIADNRRYYGAGYMTGNASSDLILPNPVVSSASACRDWCQSDERCRLWVWYKSTSGTCWRMKSQFTGATYSASFASGGCRQDGLLTSPRPAPPAPSPSPSPSPPSPSPQQMPEQPSPSPVLPSASPQPPSPSPTLLPTGCAEPPSPPANSSWAATCTGAADCRLNATCAPGFAGAPFATCQAGIWYVNGSCIASTSDVCDPVQDNQRFYGGGYITGSSLDVLKPNPTVKNASACRDACQSNTLCKQWVFAKPASAGANGTCYRTTANFTAGVSSKSFASGLCRQACGPAPAPPPNSTWVGNCTGAGASICNATCLPGTLGAPFAVCRAGTWSISGSCALEVPCGVSMTAGSMHACFGLSTGAVACTGNNWGGQLLDGYGGDHQAPEPVPALQNASTVALAAAARVTCVVLANGTAMCGGDNSYGQLGNNDTSLSFEPVPVMGLDNAQSIVLSEGHGCAVLHNTSAACWGFNQQGQLGDGTLDIMRPVPGLVANGSLAGVRLMALTRFASFASLTNGSFYIWGSNQYGVAVHAVPVLQPSMHGVEVLSGGCQHVCVALVNGSVFCRGQSGYGELGGPPQQPAYEDEDQWVKVPLAANTSVEAIATGCMHSCALLTNGSVLCWGSNEAGQLGCGSTCARDIGMPPTLVKLPASNLRAVALTAGAEFTCVALNDSSVRCFGSNSMGQLGLAPGNTIEQLQPSAQTRLGNARACLQPVCRNTTLPRVPGAAWPSCSGAVGDVCVSNCGPGYKGYISTSCLPAGVWSLKLGGPGCERIVCRSASLPTPTNASFPSSACDRLPTGVRCNITCQYGWAANMSTMCVQNGTEGMWAPIEGSGCQRIVCHNSSLPAIASVSWPGCEGRGLDERCVGECAPGWTSSRLPVFTCNSSGLYTLTVQGACEIERFVCRNTSLPLPEPGSFPGAQCDGMDVGSRCVGSCPAGMAGQISTVCLSNLTFSQSVSGGCYPAEVCAAAAVAVGTMHSCILAADDTPWCFGAGSFGALGNGSFIAQQAQPVRLRSLAGAVRVIAAGETHTCAVLKNGSLACWGTNTAGQLGSSAVAPTSGSSAVPVLVDGIRNAVDVAAGMQHTCALLSNGSIACFGNSIFNRLGNWDPDKPAFLEWGIKPTPVLVRGVNTAVSVAAKLDHTCAGLVNGTVVCWGWPEIPEALEGTAARWGSYFVKPVPWLPLPLLLPRAGLPTLAVGAMHACAVLIDHTVWCWGDCSERQCGRAEVPGALFPTSLSSNDGPAKADLLTGVEVTGVWAGFMHTMVANGTMAFAFGTNIMGLGYGGMTGLTGLVGNWPTPASELRPLPEMQSGALTAASLGLLHSCVVSGGAARCWGAGVLGQTGGNFGLDFEMYHATHSTRVPATAIRLC